MKIYDIKLNKEFLIKEKQYDYNTNEMIFTLEDNTILKYKGNGGYLVIDNEHYNIEFWYGKNEPMLEVMEECVSLDETCKYFKSLREFKTDGELFYMSIPSEHKIDFIKKLTNQGKYVYTIQKVENTKVKDEVICKYCMGDVDDRKVLLHGDSAACIYINENNHLEYAYYCEEEFIESKINYCPMCGRRLK